MVFRVLKRKLFASCLTLSLLFSASPAIAFDQNWSEGRTFTWSPYTWNNYYNTYKDALSGAKTVVTRSRSIKWNQAGADAANGLGLAPNVLEVQDGDGATNGIYLSANGVYSTNLPSPKFDRDDDDGNGTWEEAEIVIKGTILPETTYNLDYWWAVPTWVNLVSGTFSLTSQYGPYNPVTGEYEAPNYDLLDKFTYYYNFGTSSAMSVEPTFSALSLKGTDVQDGPKINNPKSKEKVVAIKKHDQNGSGYYAVKKSSGKIKVYASLKFNSSEQLNSYKKSMLDYAMELEASNKTAPVTITFNRKLTVSQLKQLLKKYAISANSLLIKGDGSDGLEWTVGIPGDKMEDSSILEQISKEQNLTNTGIVSIDGSIDLTQYENVFNDNSVFLADVSSSLIAKEVMAKSGSQNVEVIIPDVYELCKK